MSDAGKQQWFRVQAIGYVQRLGEDATNRDAFYDPDRETALVIFPRWEIALAGIEEYSHLIVVFWLDHAKRARKPPSIDRKGEKNCRM